MLEMKRDFFFCIRIMESLIRGSGNCESCSLNMNHSAQSSGGG